jgi:hypothetical protein
MCFAGYIHRFACLFLIGRVVVLHGRKWDLPHCCIYSEVVDAEPVVSIVIPFVDPPNFSASARSARIISQQHSLKTKPATLLCTSSGLGNYPEGI